MKKQILGHLARGVPAALKQFDSKSGRFLAPNGGWAVTMQDVVLPLALLHQTYGTRYYHKQDILRICQRAVDAWCDWQNEDGSFEFIKVDGSSWGNMFMPWSIFHWLETYVLLRDSLAPRKRKLWEKRLALAYEGLARTHTTPRAHNIPTWNGMSLTRAGQVFDRPDWLEIGRNQVLFSAAAQHPHGYWPEGGGPTTRYNLVYVHALGLYYQFTRDKAVLCKLQRACDFHTTFTYPDCTSVETVDGRVRYHNDVATTGWPGFSLYPRGRRLMRLMVRRLDRRGGLSPHLASTYMHSASGKEEALPMQQKRHRSVYKRRALMRKHDDWSICVSGYQADPQARAGSSRERWINTRSNCLSVWHKKTGLLIGGGNSKHDPLFSTFEVWQGGAHHLEPDRVSFSHAAGRDTIKFSYGDVSCSLHLKPIGGSKLEIVFEIPQATARRATVQAGFTLRLKEGDKICWSAKSKPPVKAEHIVDPRRSLGFYWNPDEHYSSRMLSGNGWQLTMPNESSMKYPAYPFNPYAIDNAASPADAVVSISAGFLESLKRKFILEI